MDYVNSLTRQTNRNAGLMMRCVCTAAVLAVCALSQLVSTASAQAGNDKAAAEALFDEGRKLMADQQFAQACGKFEASQRLDPGVGTMLNLADCYEKAGRTASAWAEFRETISAAHKAGSAERERIARQRVQELEPKLSYLTIVPWQGQEVGVSRDGVAIDPGVLGTAIPVDPGTHVIAASAVGKRSWSTNVVVGDHADRVSVSVPILPDEAHEAAPLAAAAEVQAPPPEAANKAPADAHSPGSTQRIVAVVAASVGVVGVVVGSVFGVKAASTWSDAKKHCDPYPYCGESGQKLSNDAQTSGTISTIAFIVGGVGLVSGAVLWFTAPSHSSEAHATLDVGPGTIMMHGRF
jgi:hypothetical protein